MKTDEFFKILESENRIFLNDEQKKACAHGSGPGLTLAIPGSGKTTLLVCRARFLQDVMGVDPRNILSLTFSKMAATNMKERYSTFFPSGAVPHFSTIHAFAFRVMRMHCESTGARMPKLLGDKGSDHSQRSLIVESLRSLGRYSVDEEKHEELINFISYNKNLLISPEMASELASGDSDAKLKASVFKIYESLKSEYGLMDFDDMITGTIDMLGKNEGLLGTIRKRYPYIQLDEAQDTSKSQYSLMEMMLGADRNLFVVADDDQSIYGFRGAFPDAILDFDKKFGGSSLYHLKYNYRSTRSIVDACSEFIKSNRRRYRKNMKSNSESSDSIEVIDFLTVDQRNDFIMASFDRSGGTTGILYRNNISAVSIAHTLVQSGVEFDIRDSCQSFFDSKVLRDMSSFIEFSLSGSDLSTFERIYYKTDSFISKEVVSYASGKYGDVITMLLRNPELKKWQRANIIRLGERFEALSGMSPREGVSFICSEMGYIQYLANSSKKGVVSMESSRIILDTIKDVASSYSTHIEFLLALESLKKTIRSNTHSTSGNVKLSTMHSSKGLEYDNVIIVDAVKGIIPSFEAAEKAKGGCFEMMEEERRLFYVALSRGKSSVKVLNVSSKFGDKVFPSQFVDELLSVKPSSLIKRIEVAKDIAAETDYTFFSGRDLIHFKYGEGRIVRVQESGISEIMFSDGKKRSLSLPICIEKKLIEVVS